MPRLILTTGGGARTADVEASALNVASVQDAVQATQASAVIVSVPEITSQTRQELASLPGVTGVHEDLQGLPLVADEEAVSDFLNGVGRLRGQENVPPLFELETTTEGQPMTDGGSGAVVLPVPAGEAEPDAEATGPVTDADAALEFIGVPELHEQGLTGQDVISVVVDTGACPTAIRSERQLEGADLSGEDDPWSFLSEHGGMSMGIMAGDDSTEGIRLGVLPDSEVFPIKSTLAGSELMQAQDIIVSLAERDDRTVLVNNCLPADAKVSTTTGPVSIADVEVGDEVHAANLDVRGQQVCEVTDTFESGEKEVYDLETRTRSVSASNNHPFLVADQEQERLVWKALEDIDEGDLIAIHRRTTAEAGQPHRFRAADGGQLVLDTDQSVRLDGNTSSNGCRIPSKTSKALCRLLGALYGDGSVTYSTSEKNRVLFTANLEKYPGMERYVKEFERLFGVEWIEREKRGEQGKATTFVVNNKPLADFLHHIGIRVGEDRTLPGWIYTVPVAQKIAFIQGYLDADGHVDKRGVIHVRTTHGDMARELWELMVSAGIKVTRLKTQVQDIEIAPSGNFYEDHQVFHFTAPSLEDNRRIGSSLEMYQKRLSQDRAKSINYQYVDCWTPEMEGFVFDRVQSIGSRGVKPTYDIEVAGAHNFVAEGVLLHNSWGFPECEGICQHPVTQAVASAADHPDVIQVFAAGNEASGVTGCGQECDGSTPGISGPNSLSNVITVAASGRNGEPAEMQAYSSRGGPGPVSCGDRKPDVTAPVFGRMPYGCGDRDMGNGGGTSAACPEVAGVIGQVASATGETDAAAIRSILAAATDDIEPGNFDGCSGDGLIDAPAAVAAEPTGGLGAGDNRRVAALAASGLVAGGILGAALRERAG